MLSTLTILFSPWTLLIAVGAYFVYRQIMAPYDFFQKKGVAFKKPWPVFGAMGSMTLRQESIFNMVLNMYNEFKGHRYFGAFDFSRPVLVVRDPEIIKQVTVKDFEYFLDHRPFLSDMDNDPLFGKSLFLLTGQRWRDMRATLSPAFTGSKMRQMFQLIVDCSEQATSILKKEAKESSKPIVREMKDVFTRFTSDVIASSAFGIKVNSLEDRENEFYTMGKESTSFSSLTVMLKLLVIGLAPRIATLFKMGLFTNKQNKFYNELVHGTIKHREKNGIIRHDMIHLLMEARKGTLRREAAVGSGTSEGFATVQEVNSEDLQGTQKQVWDDEDLTAQCFLFFLAGFDTSSTLLCLAATELMENPEIQQTLFEECESLRVQLDGKPLSYDVLQKMKYMDLVVSETLRKWPPAMITDRQCVKPYELKDEESGRTIKFNKGDGIWIPVVAIHRDPEFYPDPDRFDPERFSDERKGSIKPFTYLPFGSGPRNCIGSRFALMECKAFLYYLLLNFSFEPAPTSVIPMRMAKSGFSVMAENGYNLILKPRA